MCEHPHYASVDAELTKSHSEYLVRRAREGLLERLGDHWGLGLDDLDELVHDLCTADECLPRPAPEAYTSRHALTLWLGSNWEREFAMIGRETALFESKDLKDLKAHQRRIVREHERVSSTTAQYGDGIAFAESRLTALLGEKECTLTRLRTLAEWLVRNCESHLREYTRDVKRHKPLMYAWFWLNWESIAPLLSRAVPAACGDGL
jgi:hypothetical protein